MILSGSDDGTARAWDLRTLKCVSSFAAREKAGSPLVPVSSVVTSMYREHVVYLSAGPCVLEYDMRMPAERCFETCLVQPHASYSQPFGKHDISQIALNHAGSMLAAVDEGGCVTVMDLQTRAMRAMPARHRGMATCMAWRTYLQPIASQLLTGGMDMRLLVHETGGEGGLLHDMNTTAQMSSRGQFVVNPPFVQAVDASADGRWLLAGAGDGALRVYDLMDGRLEHQFEEGAHKTSITCVAFPKVAPPLTLHRRPPKLTARHCPTALWCRLLACCPCL